jgi:hypothetical protein
LQNRKICKIFLTVILQTVNFTKCHWLSNLYIIILYYCIIWHVENTNLNNKGRYKCVDSFLTSRFKKKTRVIQIFGWRCQDKKYNRVFPYLDSKVQYVWKWMGAKYPHFNIEFDLVFYFLHNIHISFVIFIYWY